MAKGLDKHKARIGALNAFGKDLARRAKGHCEMCGASDVKLHTYEVEPVADEPDFDHCLLACDTCAEQMDNPKRINADHWRCLNTAIWSEVPAVQVAAVHQLKRIDQPWARELEEQLYLTPEIEEWLAKIG